MEIVLFLIPFIVSVFLLIFFKKHTVWWEYLILIIPSLLFTLGTKEIMIKANTTDTEYYGGYIVKIRHYDEWDEWIKRTCTRQVPVGKDKDGNTIYKEEKYDCSYRQYHPEYWVYVTNLSNFEYSLDKKLFEYIKKRFNSPMVFVDMHRNYYRIDGDAQDYFWSGTRETIYTVTEEHWYENKIKASNSIFKFEEISKKEAKELNLYDYPNINNLDQNPILSKNLFINSDEIESIKYVNGYYGKLKEFRCFILLFNSTDGINKAYQQQSYWQGGNKNELIICFGIKPDRTVDWCYAFSWEDSQEMAITIMNLYRNNEKLNINILSNQIIENLDKWKRKDFDDFKYIKVELTKGQYILLFILTLLINVGICFFILMNEYEN